MIDDYYTALIRERGDAEAAKILADECRKKDLLIAQLTVQNHLERINQTIIETGDKLIQVIEDLRYGQ